MLLSFVVPAVYVYAETASDAYFDVEHLSTEDLLADGKQLAISIASEGMVLLKNEGNVLPFEGVTNISVFGKNGQSPFYNALGSGIISSNFTNLYQSLENEGFVLNPELKTIYAENSNYLNVRTGSSGGAGEQTEIPVTDDIYNSSVTDSYANFNDAAIIVIGRGGGEGGDFKRANVPGHSDITEHGLELNDNEKALIQHVKDSGQFDKVICLINTATTFELTALEDDDFIDAILWTGTPGGVGFEAMAKILTGEVNPSGRTSAIYPADFKQDPTWFNFGNLNQIYGSDNGGTAEAYGDSYNGSPYMFMKSVIGGSYDTYNEADYSGITMDEHTTIFQQLNYAEGIYLGYRWYETAATINGYFDTNNLPDGETDPYYNRTNGVLYPFGYGLSYTTFDWQVGNPTPAVITALAANTEISVPVTITNTGSIAGKETIQLYSTPPYTDGEIEKAVKNLITFAKTDILEPGQSQTLTLTFNARDLADFDWNDANHNTFQGYELEAGSYDLSISGNSHDVVDTISYTVNSDIQYNGSDAAHNYNDGYGSTAEAWFSQDDEYNTNAGHWLADGTLDDDYIYVSRASGQWGLPFTTDTLAKQVFTDEAFDILMRQIFFSGSSDVATDPWVIDFPGIPNGWTQASDDDVDDRIDGLAAIQLIDMAGLTFDDPQWEQFMNQLSWNELAILIGNGSYNTAALPSIGKPRTSDQDGPVMTASGYTSWPCEPIQAATFNVELGYQLGQFIGEESYFNGRTGWYAPGANTNRSPFAGRVFEYYSQDGILAGMFGAAVVKGATDKGVMVYAKHLGLNDQESYRYGSGGYSAFVNEQALRQIYQKPWEYMVKYGNLNAAKTSFNKVGLIHAANNYRLTNSLMRDEWGFKGHMVTDMYSGIRRWSVFSPGSLIIRNGVIPMGVLSNLDGRYIDGTWDDTEDKLLVADALVVTDWERTDNDLDNDNIPSATSILSETTEDGDIQWYYVRQLAKRLLYTVGNSNAMLDRVRYNINWDLNDDVSNVINQKVVHGNSVSIPESPTREGYTFSGWFDDADMSYVSAIDLEANEPAVYYAGWALNDGILSVEYNLNYDAAPDAQVIMISNGTHIPHPINPTREGYDFGGWYEAAIASEGSEVDYITPINENIVVFAKWTESIKYVLFINNFTSSNYGYLGAVTPLGDQLPDTPDQVIDIDDTDPSSTIVTVYIFTGWYVDSARTILADLTQPPTSQFYYAGWEETDLTEVPMTIYYDVNYGSEPAIEVTSHIGITSGDTIPNVPTRDGYTFVGWFSDSSLTIPQNVEALLLTETTYYAKWEQNTYHIKIDYNEPNVGDGDIDLSYGDTVSEPATPTRDGYTFMGWFSDVALTTPYDFDTLVSSDITIYAKWEQITYTLTFVINGMETTVELAEGESIVLPDDPTLDGSVFDGWFSNGSEFTSTSMPDHDVTIIAQFTARTGCGSSISMSSVFTLCLFVFFAGIGTIIIFKKK